MAVIAAYAMRLSVRNDPLLETKLGLAGLFVTVAGVLTWSYQRLMGRPWPFWVEAIALPIVALATIFGIAAFRA